jgi:predicted transcriptional regulator
VACINSDGTLTPVAHAVLSAFRSPATPAQVADSTGMPFYRIRASLRELQAEGLVSETDGRYEATAAGLDRL